VESLKLQSKGDEAKLRRKYKSSLKLNFDVCCIKTFSRESSKREGEYLDRDMYYNKEKQNHEVSKNCNLMRVRNTNLYTYNEVGIELVFRDRKAPGA